MRYYGITDQGLIRETNQDNYVTASNENGDVFALVCDGIGGGRGGDVASKMTIDFFSEVFSKNQGFKSEEEVVAWIQEKVKEANDSVFTKAAGSRQLKGMGTTMVGVLLTSVGRFIINIGDSRVYSLKKEDFKQITHDHTLVEDLLSSGEITAEEARVHPKRNVLTNALGVWDKARVDITKYEEEAQAFLVCSDGLYGYLDHEEIKKVMLSQSLTTGRKVQKLLKLALDVGGYDNITMILIELEAGDGR
ncbi:MAG: Stp1/IreP family PP2C-type Ser/Thr phosphatase [Anaerorhabdus sp.]